MGMIGRLTPAFAAAAAAAFVLAGSSTAAPPQKLPILWDFVDTGLCGFPIHSVGTGTRNAVFVVPGSEGPFGITTGPLTINLTNLSTGRSVKLQVPSPTRFDLTTSTLSLFGQTYGLGIGLPYASFKGSMSISFETGAYTAKGTFTDYDLCHALAPHTSFFQPATTTPPWGLPTAPLGGVYANNLIPILGGFAEHLHVHLDIFDNGSPVTVPAGIGLVDPVGDPDEGTTSAADIFSPLHTHDTSGIVHIETSAPPLDMTLGQFFDVWQVRLGNGCLGATCTGLRAWVNGFEWTGDARSIPLTQHAEIVLALGPTYPSPVPSSYDFPPGL
jgi:hypothetical protein